MHLAVHNGTQNSSSCPNGSNPPSRAIFKGFGKGLGRVLGGFGNDFGRVLAGSGSLLGTPGPFQRRFACFLFFFDCFGVFV